ncbi:hypothetical protein BDF22DRAFT_741243 [Syncephalis plumigaleata]|nr:hypothetical protein BDF22DRAFT_741243 [Syncephalis plumigaleata]
MRKGYSSVILFSATLLVALLSTPSNASPFIDPSTHGVSPDPVQGTASTLGSPHLTEECTYGVNTDGTCKDATVEASRINSRTRLFRRGYTTADANEYTSKKKKDYDNDNSSKKKKNDYNSSSSKKKKSDYDNDNSNKKKKHNNDKKKKNDYDSSSSSKKKHNNDKKKKDYDNSSSSKKKSYNNSKKKHDSYTTTKPPGNNNDY